MDVGTGLAVHTDPYDTGAPWRIRPKRMRKKANPAIKLVRYKHSTKGTPRPSDTATDV